MSLSTIYAMDIIYREGKKEDSYRIAELDSLASGGAVEYLFHDLIADVSPVRIVAQSLENDQYPYTFRSAIVAEDKQGIVGMALSFPSKYHGITDEMRNFLPADRLEHFKDFFNSRVEGSYFLDALCVDEAFRRRGIARRLIELTQEKARKEGYDSLSLIVFADNDEARSLYDKYGFTVVKNIALRPHERIRYKDGCVLMNCTFQSS